MQRRLLGAAVARGLSARVVTCDEAETLGVNSRADLAEAYPTARIDRNVLFVDDGNLITSAGTAAGIDACLHLVRREMGSAVTNVIARRMVVPPQRDGGQRQYIEMPVPKRCSDSFAPQLDWILANLHEVHTVASAYYFEEGTAQAYTHARFGQFKLAANGKTLLIGLCDAKGMLIAGTKREK